MKSTITRKEDGTISLHITIDAKDVKKTRDEVLDSATKEATLQGFRKGMAPRDMVEKSLDPMRLQEDVLRKLLPQAYSEAVKEQKIQPVMSPRVRVEKLETDKDWEFSAETCEAPQVTLGKYKEAVRKVTAASKIVMPRKDPSTSPDSIGTSSGQGEKGPNMDEIIKALLDSVQVTVPEVLIETETERLLSQLLDEVKSLGLSLDQYLSSTHKNIDQIKEEYKDRARRDVTFEFVLQEIANQEKIVVEQKELEEALEKAQSPEERKNLEANIYLLASILRQQKTLDYLKNL